MKKVLLSLLAISFALMASAEIRVLSDVKLGEGFYPRFADAETVTYLASETAGYAVEKNDDALRVDNENLDLNLYRNGKKMVLKPHGDVNYICASLAPSKDRILFRSMKGTAICDLNGKELVNLGREINAPVWFGNEYVVGMDSEHDGYRNTASSIVIASVDGKIFQHLTDPANMGIFPDVDAASGRIVYNTENGDVRLLQLNMTEQPIRKVTPRLERRADALLLDRMARKAKAAQGAAAKYKIYINPGHGGFESDDRLMYLYPVYMDVNNSKLNEAGGYTKEQSFWESQSNLDKGMRLDTLLRNLGFDTKMSRIVNTPESDMDLYDIVVEANTYNADFMLSIHSNAGNPSNYILQLFSGMTPGDNSSYSHMPANSALSCEIATLMGKNQYMNEVSCWSREPMIAGDKTFAKNIMGWSNGYGVLRWLKVPGTLSEGMMHDYLPETYRLMNIDYKRQEAFYFAKTFVEHFQKGQLPYGAIGGKINDDYQKQIFPDYKPRRNTRDVLRPINRGVVELWQDGKKLESYTTDTLYNGCYFFWNLQPGTYVVKAVPEGYYPQEETLVVENNKISYANFSLSLMRQTPPEVISYEPHVELADSQQVSVDVVIDFNWDMHEDSTAAAFTVTPAVEGAIKFEDGGRRLRFTPATRFEPGTEYTVNVSTQACHPDTKFENHLQKPFSFKFRTKMRGSLRMIQTYPTTGETGVPLQPSFIGIFDAKVVNKTAQNVSIKGPEGTLKVNTRSFKYNQAPEPNGFVAFELVDPLKPNTEYQLLFMPSISDTEGVLLNETVTIDFTTGDEKESEVPIFHNMDTEFFVVDKDNSVGVSNSATLRYTSKKMEGQASNKLSYTFSETSGEAIYSAKDLTAIQGNSNSTLGMHVFADYSFNTLYAKWAVEGDIKYTKICDLDYAGWLYQEADMSELPEGVDYQFMGLRLVRQNSFLSAKGEFCIDALRVQYEPTAVEDIIVEQNANRKLIENGYLHILFNGVKYNAEGKVIK